MGKKKKGSKGSGKSKKGGSSEGAERKLWVEPKMTMGEAVVAFQLDVKRRSCEEFGKEIEEMRAINERQRQKNAKLKADQMIHIRELLRQVKEKDNEMAEVDVVGRDQVEHAFLEKQRAARIAEREIEEMQEKIEELQAETDQLRDEVAKRLEYKNAGRYAHKRHIERLEQMLVDWKEDVEQTSRDLKKSLKIARHEISRHAEESISSQKDTAAELAIVAMDPNSRNDIVDNETLHKELVLHREDVTRLREATDRLEQSNLDMFQEMMEYSAEELELAEKAYVPDSDSDVEEEEEEDAQWENNPFEETSDEGESGETKVLSPTARKELMVRGKGILQAQPQSMLPQITSQDSATKDDVVDDVNPPRWPVTVQMLKAAVKEPNY
ncbi:coiled-coil domain-containing protein 83-like [Oscarella lobularis]|uniref:coiled-coil domain-containing protein 83-like n=1 Tax=Oscarella lobularis TaxID=121494 RepID=UPI003313CE5C